MLVARITEAREIPHRRRLCRLIMPERFLESLLCEMMARNALRKQLFDHGLIYNSAVRNRFFLSGAHDGRDAVVVFSENALRKESKKSSFKELSNGPLEKSISEP